jgi:hypothetical protein
MQTLCCLPAVPHNLDARQTRMAPAEATLILYFTWLMALAFGPDGQAALARNLVDPKPLLATRGLLAS